jgi:hypothetical protein
MRVKRGMGINKMAMSVEILNGDEAREVIKMLVHFSAG